MSAMPSSVMTMPWIQTATDGLDTETLSSQLEVEQIISDILTQALSPSLSALTLHKDNHLRFITGLLKRPLPAGFVALDASRPWLLYWTSHSLALFEGELDPVARARVIETLQACQNESGGFGGGPGQISHLAPTYAAVMTLCYMGQEGWDAIDRRGLYNFFMSVKQSDGSFIMHEGGEVDVRGCYCALTVATLLNILTPDLAKDTSSFIASCQTYEGGLASSSHLFSNGPDASTATAAAAATAAAPLGEAHGGYAFCAFASWVMLQPFRQQQDQQEEVLGVTRPARRELDLAALTRWATAMQANPIEGGGFRGRSNKLVDGCYSWWCGGLFGLLAGLLGPTKDEGDDDSDDETAGARLGWTDLYDRRALQEYVLLLAQAPHGGLRDKPGKGADAYHTCYNLSGLAAAQHKFVLGSDTVAEKGREWVQFGGAESEGEDAGRVVIVEEEMEEPGREQQPNSTPLEMILGEDESREQARERMKDVWAHNLGWKRMDTVVVGDKDNELMPTHPVFNVSVKHAESMMGYFYQQE